MAGLKAGHCADYLVRKGAHDGYLKWKMDLYPVHRQKQAQSGVGPKMANTASFSISKDLFLVGQDFGQAAAPAKPVELPTDHFAVIDCSGSMYGDLPQIREQLKRKLPKILGPKDTISIIWFSGRGQFGTLLEGEPVATLTDLKTVEQAIDRWLRPQGLTGFTEPLQEAVKVVERVRKKNPGGVASLFFMSDGHDNQGTRATILRAMESVAEGFQSTTVVEYGYYADRNLLSAMAERAGGAHIFAEDFDRYAPAFEAVMQKRPSGAPRVEQTISGDPIGGFVFALHGGELVTYSVEGGKVRVPKDLTTVWYLSATSLGKAQTLGASSKTSTPQLQAAYAAVSLFSVRMKSNVVYALLKELGDVEFVESFSTCFGKQRYSEFQEKAKLAAFGTGMFAKGYDPTKLPKDDAFTVLELLDLLASDENNRVLLDHPDFRYSRIGRGRVDASDQLTAEEQTEIQALTVELGATKKTARIKEINQRIAEITANKPAALVFKADPAPNGYPISSLVFNEDRPNVSFMVRKPGTVDLTSRIGKSTGTLNENASAFPTHVFRNYAVIKDGLINIDKLPVLISKGTWGRLLSVLPSGVISASGDESDSVTAVINLRALPVINRNMVKDVSAKQFFQLQYDLLVAQAEQKVYNSYVKELLPKERSEGLKERHGEETAAWLKEQGITDGGFSPKGTLADATDFYMGKELKVSIKGYSKLPSLKEAQAQMQKGKLNGPGALMAPTIKLVEDFLSSDLYKKSQGNSKTLEVWLEGQATAAKKKARDILFQIAQTTFAIVVGQIWFQEFASLDENTLTIEPEPGTKIECKAELKDIEIKL